MDKSRRISNLEQGGGLGWTRGQARGLAVQKRRGTREGLEGEVDSTSRRGNFEKGVKMGIEGGKER